MENSEIFKRLQYIMNQPDPEINEKDLEEFIMSKTGYPIEIDYSVGVEELKLAGKYDFTYEAGSSEVFKCGIGKTGKHSEAFMRVPFKNLGNVHIRNYLCADGYHLLWYAKEYPHTKNNTIALGSEEKTGEIKYHPAIKDNRLIIVKAEEKLYESDWYVLLLVI